MTPIPSSSVRLVTTLPGHTAAAVLGIHTALEESRLSRGSCAVKEGILSQLCLGDFFSLVRIESGI